MTVTKRFYYYDLRNRTIANKSDVENCSNKYMYYVLHIVMMDSISKNNYIRPHYTCNAEEGIYLINTILT